MSTPAPELPPVDFGAVKDQGIPTLNTVLGPVTLAAHLRRVLPDRCGSVQQIRIHILKRHRTRCTFEIEWPDNAERRAVIGKVYGSDRADVYWVMDAICRAGFGPNEAFSIPEPLAYDPALRLLLQEKVTGSRAKQVLLTGAERDRMDATERCAEWLARFQAKAPRLGESYRTEDVLSALDEWSQPFDAAGDVLAGKAKRLRERIEVAASTLAPNEPCAAHGEYTCGQVLIEEGHTVAPDSPPRGSNGSEVVGTARTVTCDWDGYNVADPARDVACFVVDLRRLAWKNPAARTAFHQAARVFLQTYLLHCRKNAAANLPFHAGARCLRLAKRDIEDELPEKSEAMLDEGLRVMEQGPSSWVQE